MPSFDTALLWFRRDLRDFDHAALYHALKQSRRVFCAFIFDKTILQPLLESGLKADRRVEFIHDSLIELDCALREMGGIDRLRRPAVFPHLQSHHAVRKIRPRRRIHPPLPAATGQTQQQAHPRPWLLDTMELKLAGITLGDNYPNPIVQHDVARKHTLERYAVVKKAV